MTVVVASRLEAGSKRAVATCAARTSPLMAGNSAAGLMASVLAAMTTAMLVIWDD